MLSPKYVFFVMVGFPHNLQLNVIFQRKLFMCMKAAKLLENFSPRIY